MKNDRRNPKESSAGTIVSVLLFVAILYWLGAFGDAARLWERIGP